MTAPPVDPGERPLTLDETAVDLNRFVDVDDLTAIEVYARGENMPVTLQVRDNACRVVALWTGSWRP